MNYFSVMVIGNNPEEQMAQFDASLKVPHFLKYKIDDASELRKKAILTVENMITEMNDNPNVLEYLHNHLSEIKEMADIEYFSFLTKTLQHDEEGNAWDDSNPNGKWTSYRLGKENAIELVKNDGTVTMQCRKGDVDWSAIHLAKQKIYKRTWEMVIENQEPKHDADKIMLAIMGEKKDYLLNFKTKDNYIKYNTSYWNYAVIKDGVWEDTDNHDSIDWVINFYETFVEPLNDDELITIYEYQMDDAND